MEINNYFEDKGSPAHFIIWMLKYRLEFVTNKEKVSINNCVCIREEVLHNVYIRCHITGKSSKMTFLKLGAKPYLLHVHFQSQPLFLLKLKT
jgi:hypothetical protein